MNVTPLEMQFLRDMTLSCHTTDGNGIVMWLTPAYCSMPMQQARAVAVTLQTKGIIFLDPADPEYARDPEGPWMPGHVEVRDDFQEEDANARGGYRLVNVEVVA